MRRHGRCAGGRATPRSRRAAPGAPQAGSSILMFGSSELVNTLMQHRLIDVYRLMVYPITLGTGRRFFTDGGNKIGLTLTDAKTTSTGVAVLTYQAAA